MKLKIQTDRLIREILTNRQKRQRRFALIAALAVLTGGNVFWVLRETGTAITEDQLTGTEEHIRSDDSGSQTVSETPDVWELSYGENG